MIVAFQESPIGDHLWYDFKVEWDALFQKVLYPCKPAHFLIPTMLQLKIHSLILF